MVYKMRFVQYFDKKDQEDFWRIEHKFAEMEKRTPGLKEGRRYVPVIGREPSNTMIWEAEYNTLEEAMEALELLENSSEHDKLLEEQIGYMRDNFVEVYKEMQSVATE